VTLLSASAAPLGGPSYTSRAGAHPGQAGRLALRQGAEQRCEPRGIGRRAPSARNERAGLRAVAELGHRPRQHRVPERVEHPPGVGHHGAGGHHVAVAEVEHRVRVEVLVADVAPAEDRDTAVDGEGLVVHAAVEPRELAQEVERPAQAAPLQRRVEDADLDVRVLVEQRQHVVAPAHVDVVQQQPHPHPAIGRRVQPGGDVAARGVAVPDVVLRVDRAFGGLDERRALEEGLAPRIEQPDAAVAAVQGAGRAHAGGQRARGRHRIGQHLGARRRLRRQPRAGREHEREQQAEGRVAQSCRRRAGIGMETGRCPHAVDP